MQRSVVLDVLWLEDDPEFAEVGRRLLELGPLSVSDAQPAFEPVLRTATSVEEATRLLEDRLPDILVTDLNVPDSTGADTILRLRERAPHVPLLVLTGNDDPDSSMLAALENADFLCKDDVNQRNLWRTLYMALTRAGTRT